MKFFGHTLFLTGFLLGTTSFAGPAEVREANLRRNPNVIKAVETLREIWRSEPSARQGLRERLRPEDLALISAERAPSYQDIRGETLQRILRNYEAQRSADPQLVSKALERVPTTQATRIAQLSSTIGHPLGESFAAERTALNTVNQMNLSSESRQRLLGQGQALNTILSNTHLLTTENAPSLAREIRRVLDMNKHSADLAKNPANREAADAVNDILRIGAHRSSTLHILEPVIEGTTAESANRAENIEAAKGLAKIMRLNEQAELSGSEVHRKTAREIVGEGASSQEVTRVMKALETRENSLLTNLKSKIEENMSLALMGKLDLKDIHTMDKLVERINKLMIDHPEHAQELKEIRDRVTASRLVAFLAEHPKFKEMSDREKVELIACSQTASGLTTAAASLGALYALRDHLKGGLKSLAEILGLGADTSDASLLRNYILPAAISGERGRVGFGPAGGARNSSPTTHGN